MSHGGGGGGTFLNIGLGRSVQELRHKTMKWKETTVNSILYQAWPLGKDQQGRK